jgi:hypothetical protein
VRESVIDALAFETHFLSHLAPVWRALPSEVRGRFIVETALAGQEPDLVVEPMDGAALRRLPLPKAIAGAPGPTALVASYGDIKVGRRLGYRRFIFLEHGIGQSYAGDRQRAAQAHGSYSGGVDRIDNGLFLVPGANPADRWRQAYPHASVAVVGSPRLDSRPLRQPETPAPVAAISFHWPAFVCAESGSAIGEYVPHLKAIRTELAAAGIGLIGHGHPRFFDRIVHYFNRAGIPAVASFEDVCRQADVYVCDNSSTMYEFAATGRPVVVLNSRHFRRNVHHGLRFWDAADVGIQVDDPQDLTDAVEQALTDPPEVALRREAALNVVYAYRSGAAGRAARTVADWLSPDATMRPWHASLQPA